MKGFPKVLNSKQDYFNCLPAYPNETKEALKALLDNRFSWFDVAVLADGVSGITDSTHRVIGDSEKIQQELREDENALIFKLGFTVQEVEGLLNA